MPESRYNQPGAIGLPPADVTEIEESEHLALETDLSHAEAQAVIDVARRRYENRGEERWDVIVVFEDWARAPDYEIVTNQVVLAGSVDNHSEKAYSFRGGFELADEIFDMTADELADEYITDIVYQIDQTGDDGYADRLAAGYWPKSAVAGIFVYEPEQ